MKTDKLILNGDAAVTLTCYIQDPSEQMPNVCSRPAVLVLPGGGYAWCSDREAEPIALSYAAEGYNAFVLRYTVGDASAFPKPLNDAETALETIINRAEEWHVDCSKIAVIGFSAGGHLAAALGTMGRIKPSALILCYPCITAETNKILKNNPTSLEDKVDETTPPTFIFHTWKDSLVPASDSLAFATALYKAGVLCEAHIFQNGVHGLSLAKPQTSSGNEELVDDRAAAWFGLSADWLRGLWA